MKLREVRNVDEYLTWLDARGFRPGENVLTGTPTKPGIVYPVHGETSLHYKVIKNGQVVDGPRRNITYQGRVVSTRQGKLAVDVNVLTVDLGKMPFDSETEALRWLFTKSLTVLGPEGHDVLDEMFFDGLGFMKEYGPKVNHPIGGHDGHLHQGFKVLRWGSS